MNRMEKEIRRKFIVKAITLAAMVALAGGLFYTAYEILGNGGLDTVYGIVLVIWGLSCLHAFWKTLGENSIF